MSAVKIPARRRVAFGVFGAAIVGATAVWIGRWEGAVIGSRPLRPDDVLAIVIGVVGAYVVHTVAHEAGHAIAAIVMRIPVIGVRVFWWRIGTVNRSRALGAVRLNPSGRGRAIPQRLAFVTLMGPVTNLLVAAVAVRYAHESGPPALREAMVCLAVVGIGIGAENLLPIDLGDLHNDGYRLLQRLLHPAHARAELIAREDRMSVVTPASADDLDKLRVAMDDPRMPVATRGASALLRATKRPLDDRTRAHPLWGEVERFARFGRRPDIDASARALAVAIASFILAVDYLNSLGQASTDPLSPQVRQIAELAEIGYAAVPEMLRVRTSLAFARLIQDRPQDSRALLAAVPLHGVSPVDEATTHAIRGLAELELGDAAQARRLAEAGRRADPGSFLVRVLDAHIGAAESRRNEFPASAESK